jgi:hypothetical protein
MQREHFVILAIFLKISALVPLNVYQLSPVGSRTVFALRKARKVFQLLPGVGSCLMFCGLTQSPGAGDIQFTNAVPAALIVSSAVPEGNVETIFAQEAGACCETLDDTQL